MQNLYEKILEKWFYKDNEKVVRLTDIKEIFENATEESVPLDLLVMQKIAEGLKKKKAEYLDWLKLPRYQIETSDEYYADIQTITEDIDKFIKFIEESNFSV